VDRVKRPTGRLRLAIGLAAWLLALPASAAVEGELAFHRGVAAYGDGKLDEARQSFEKVLAEDPEDREGLRYLALVLLAQGEAARALELQDRALTLDPADREVVFERGVTLLELGRPAEARATFHKVLAEDPDDAKAQFYAGVAAYRSSDLAAAIPHLERAAQLDRKLRVQARYYTGLVEAAVGDLSAAEGSFSAVAEQSPVSPFGKSAASISDQLRMRRPERPWALALTAGSEWDSNPTLDGGDAFYASGLQASTGNRNPTYRGVFTAEGSARLFSNERASVAAGYDGYWSLNHQEEQVDLQTHGAWISGGTRLGPVRVGMRYDYAYTFKDLTESFRQLHRATPTVSFREGSWGLTQPYYQLQYANFENVDFPPNATFERDGKRHLFGMNQYFFLPAPVTYVTVGATGDVYNSDGTEWEYDGFETSLGAGYDFANAFSFSWLWRFAHRDYRENSAFSPFDQRVDDTHWVSAELAKPIIEHWVAKIAGSFSFQDSNIPVYDHTRKVVGAYLTYQW
jgi:tetratricopeptide (TPR) repeat protein